LQLLIVVQLIFSSPAVQPILPPLYPDEMIVRQIS